MLSQKSSGIIRAHRSTFWLLNPYTWDTLPLPQNSHASPHPWTPVSTSALPWALTYRAIRTPSTYLDWRIILPAHEKYKDRHMWQQTRQEVWEQIYTGSLIREFPCKCKQLWEGPSVCSLLNWLPVVTTSNACATWQTGEGGWERKKKQRPH